MGEDEASSDLNVVIGGLRQGAILQKMLFPTWMVFSIYFVALLLLMRYMRPPQLWWSKLLRRLWWN